MGNKEKSAEPQLSNKMSYEQLNDVCNQLHQQLQKAHQEINSIRMENIFARLNFLFEVLKYKESFDISFVQEVISEVESLLRVKKEEKLDKE